VTPDQWFTLWMTVITTVGGGAVTLGGVALGFLFARRSDRRQRWNAELSYWIGELGEIYRRFLAVHPETEQQAYEAILAISDDLMQAHRAHPTPRSSVGDALVTPVFMAIGAASGIVPSPKRPDVIDKASATGRPMNHETLCRFEYLRAKTARIVQPHVGCELRIRRQCARRQPCQ
jgi:hypothetical protein